MQSDLEALASRVTRLERHNRLLLRVIAILFMLMAMTLLVSQDEFRNLRSDLVRLLGRNSGPDRLGVVDAPTKGD